MTLRDRTLEFSDIAESIKKQKTIIPSTKPRVLERNEFSRIAAQIRQDIGSTADKLMQLTKLAKKRTLFDDPTMEIADLTTIINEDIKNINNQITMLQQHQQSSGYGKKNKQVEEHAGTIVKSLNGKLKKTTNGFSQVLELRTETLKQQQKEREAFTGVSSPNLSRRAAESPLYRPSYTPIESSSNSNNHEIAIAMPQQMLLTQDRYLQSRSDAVAQIERTIGELQGIFRHLASMVAEQHEQIERIDKDMEMTLRHTEGAQAQLLKYLDHLSSSRWMAIKVFLVLIFFMLIFIVFFV
jgi:syntaxin 5